MLHGNAEQWDTMIICKDRWERVTSKEKCKKVESAELIGWLDIGLTKKFLFSGTNLTG